MGFPLDSYGVSVVFLWYFFGMYMIFLLDFYDISMRILLDLKKFSKCLISMIFLEGFFWNSSFFLEVKKQNHSLLSFSFPLQFFSFLMFKFPKYRMPY